MKAPGAHSVGDRRTDDERAAQRAPRREQQGPIGFSQVFALVKRGAGANGKQAKAGKKQAAAGERQAGEHAMTGGEGCAPGMAGMSMRRSAGTGGTGGMGGLNGVARRSAAKEAIAVPNALLADARAIYGATAHAHAADAAATNQPQQAHQGLMTPTLALQMTAEEARQMNAWQDARELDLSLEPEHLGPLLIRIRTDRGRVRAELIVREAEAAEWLERDSEQLRERLARLGYSDAEVIVSQREPEFFVQPA